MKPFVRKLLPALIFSLFTSVILSSCYVVKTPNIRSGNRGHNCHPNVSSTNERAYVISAFDLSSVDSKLRELFSPASLKVAHAIGILQELENLVKDESLNGIQLGTDKKVERLARLQFLHQRIMQAWLEISSVAGEMDCEEERADQIATFLKNKEDEFETRLTAVSIVLGAAGGLASGFLLTQNVGGSATEIVGIGSGLAGTVLGIMILSHKKKIPFFHPHNALKDIWEGPSISEFFPPSIWFYLCHTDPGGGEKSLREELKERWVTYGQIDTTASAKAKKIRQLMLGQGGRYTAELLTNRANMYDQLESVINLMKQDLKLLMQDLEKLYN